MFEDICTRLRESYAESQQYLVTTIDEQEEEPETLGAVDGGGAILWSNSVQSIGIILSGFIVYDSEHTILHH
jgi:hypothetical protein